MDIGDPSVSLLIYIGHQLLYTAYIIGNNCNNTDSYSFYKDAKLLRIIRHRCNDIPNDSNEKYYYINDHGTIWNPGFMPSRTELDSYECRHGMGYSRFRSSTAALTFVNLSQAILGIRPDYHGLRIDPCVSEGFDDFTVTRTFLDAIYHIEIRNPSNIQKGITHLKVDGQEISGNRIPYDITRKEYFVTAYMG